MEEGLKRVSFLYFDGTEKYLEGKELEQLVSYLKQQQEISEKQGFSPPWETINLKDCGEDVFY